MKSPSARRVAAIVVLGLLPLALAAACSGSGPPGSGGLEKTNLVVGAVPAETSMALYIAQERGIFAAHGLHVRIETIVTTDNVVPDLLHGSLDVASGQVTRSRPWPPPWPRTGWPPRIASRTAPEMQQEDGATLVGDLDQGEAQGLLIGGYTVTASWLKKYPHTAAAFAASIAEVSQVADTSLAAARHALIVNLHINPQIADLMATGTFPTTVDPSSRSRSPA